MASERLTAQELNRLLDDPRLSADEPGIPSDASLLGLLASIDREMLGTMMAEQEYAPGEVIFREGAAGDAMYLIRSGRVAVLKGSFQSPTILGQRGPGEAVGEMALLEDKPRSASVVALEHLRMLRIDRSSFQQFLNSNPAIGLSLMASLSARLRAADKVLTDDARVGKQLTRRVSELQSEKERLLELQRVRQETSDLILHDLRNPLGTVYAAIHMLEMVLPKEVLEANRDLLNLADSSLSRIQRLVDSLLDVARMEASQAELQLTEASLSYLIDEAARQASLSLKRCGISLVSSVPDDLPPVLIDVEKVERVLANLLDNAIKYTPAGGRVSVTAAAQDSQVLVSISDVGPGIPPEDRERIFERFAQVRGNEPRRRGFGLGLTFCRLAVEAHGGRIWVEPGEGGTGSRFSFTLPTASIQIAARTRPTRTGRDGGGPVVRAEPPAQGQGLTTPGGERTGTRSAR